MVTLDAPAPDFTLNNQDGKPVSLSELRGRWVVLWWYPRASSSGCSIEARTFRSHIPDFEKAGAEVVGISFDTEAANCDFAAKDSLNYQLLSDPEQSVGSAYQVIRDPDDRFFGMPKRRTFLIDPSGVVRRIFEVEDVNAHASEVLEAIQELAGTPQEQQ